MRSLFACTFSVLLGACLQAAEPFLVGVAKVDITPAYPVRLSGYGNRRTESEGVAQRIWAKALAVDRAGEEVAVLVTVDNLGVPGRITEEVAARLREKAGLSRERFALCSSHTHTAPCLSGVAPNLFSEDIPQAHQASIDRYTGELTDQIEKAALAALANRKPSRLAWGQGNVTFAQNRRTKGGPVDHALPVLRVTDPDGQVRAIFANYACHCTTLTGEFNQLHGDWAGYAQAYLERDHPGAVALFAIGCGADANPHPRGQLDHAQQHGEEIAKELKRLLALPLTPIESPLNCRTMQLELQFQELPTRAQWEERATKPGIVGYHAKVNLARLDRGEALPTTLPYFIQTWNFGHQLALVFLAGEVVVDYSLRLKKEFDAARLWVNGYANDVPCYIPSRRILQEGGYEAETSLWYYDRPARLAPETEDSIHNTVRELLPKEFLADRRKAEFPPPKSPQESLASIRTKPGLQVELVAAEPLVVDPVAIDFGPDGKLWVVEMRDFPLGMDGNWKPGGRVKFLEDENGDGTFDKATVFVEDVPFPTGVMAWRKGALVCAAPDIFFAEDRDGDGRADEVRKLFTGFATENYQARVNGLSLDYVRRNPHVAAPAPRVSLPSGSDANQLFPISQTRRRFNDPHHANRVTSACGLGIYRDELIGPEFYHNAFVCEPVHNLIHRMVISENGMNLTAKRAADEERSEFLASTDNWFRPVQAYPGPDGALWIVDMYRFVVEHPRWITLDRLKELDLRAGDDKGRIYRVSRQNSARRPIRDLTQLPTSELVKSLDQLNGAERDRIHLELLWRNDPQAVPPLRELAESSARPPCQVQALSLLDGLKAIDSSPLLRLLSDPNPQIRRHAVRVSESLLAVSAIKRAVLGLIDDESPWVRYQLALTLGDWAEREAGHALAKLALRSAEDPWLQAAVLTSASRWGGLVLQEVLGIPEAQRLPVEFLGQLIATAVGTVPQESLERLASAVAFAAGNAPQAWRFSLASRLLESLERRNAGAISFTASKDGKTAARMSSLTPVTKEARAVAAKLPSFAPRTFLSCRTDWNRT